MKSLIVRLFALILGFGGSLSADMVVDSFSMYRDVNGPSGTCDQGITLILDKGLILKEIAVMKDFVAGTCEIYVPENTRIYELSLVHVDRCAHAHYEGSRETVDGREIISIIDGRNTRCGMSIHRPKADIELRIGTDTLFSFSRSPLLPQ